MKLSLSVIIYSSTLLNIFSHNTKKSKLKALEISFNTRRAVKQILYYLGLKTD